jgi:cytidine deaminase
MDASDRGGPEGSDDAALVRAARAVAARAYSPYSGLRVGAALRARDGSVHVGCNVENASFGLTICAERSALIAAVAQGAREHVAIAVAVERDAPLLPCGACRQVLREFGAGLRVICVGAGAERVERTLEELLPDSILPGDVLGGGRG